MNNNVFQFPIERSDVPPRSVEDNTRHSEPAHSRATYELGKVYELFEISPDNESVATTETTPSPDVSADSIPGETLGAQAPETLAEKAAIISALGGRVVEMRVRQAQTPMDIAA